jgi:hypothetical protein
VFKGYAVPKTKEKVQCSRHRGNMARETLGKVALSDKTHIKLAMFEQTKRLTQMG